MRKSMNGILLMHHPLFLIKTGNTQDYLIRKLLIHNEKFNLLNWVVKEWTLVFLSIGFVFFTWTIVWILHRQTKNRRDIDLVRRSLERLGQQEEPAMTLLHRKNRSFVDSGYSGRKNNEPTLSLEQMDALMEKIMIYMREEKPYLDTKFNMNKLCDALDINRTYLSLAINNKTGQRFEAFINRYRIAEAIELLMEEESAQYTLEYLASKVGFQSKSTFNRSFKQFTGINPSYFQKEVKRSGRSLQSFLDQFDNLRQNNFLWRN